MEAANEQTFCPEEAGDFEDIWETIAPTLCPEDVAVASMAFGETIRPAHPSYEDLLRYVTLPTLEIDTDTGRKQELSLGTTIGEGGMGIVHEAKQVPLHRSVAVKKVRSEVRTPEATYKLLQEAWVTGLLEHPNITPVYQLGQDADGTPMMVMKKIIGTSWRDILKGQSAYPSPLRDANTPLERHLGVLSKICQAVQFAHGKGILHRDIKPENVMIGTHGEVYLVDWGLAVSLTEDKPFIALASRAKGVAGTPSYMAPEMATGKGEWLSKATDIYLLGAVLHEIVTGQPPHIGDDLQSVLFHAFTSMPHDYGESIPEELAAICHKAMAPKPEDRHESVEAFRQSVVAFLQHRHSLSMSAEATTHFAELCQVLEKPLPLSSTDQLDAYTLFGRCRFGFEEALRIWEDNEQASKGLQSVLKAMAAFEMEQGASHAASVLLAQLAEPDAALQQRLDELLAQKEEEEKEFEALKQFQHEHDLTVSQGARAIHVLIIGILWSASFVLLGTLEALGLYQVQHLHYILADVVFCLFAIGFGYTKRGIFFSNVANRRLAGSFLLAVFSLVIFGVISLLLELTVPEAFALVLVMLFLVLMMLAVTIDFKMMGPASVYLLAAFVAAVQPRFIFFIHAGASLASFLWLAKIWSPSMCSDEGIYLKLQGQIKQTFEAKLEALQQAHRAARKSRQTQ